MKSIPKMFIYSFLISASFVGGGLMISFFRMDNASKEYIQTLYFVILLAFALLGNIALMTKTAGKSRRSVNLFDFSVSALNMIAGLFCLVWFKEAHLSFFTIVCLFIFVVGVFGTIRATLIAGDTVD